MNVMFSIVIPTKNEERYLGTLLASIARQSVPPLEIIVADAQSTDRTREIAAQFGCRLVPGGLPGVGRNRGATTATSELILFLDADVQLLDPQFLEKAYTEMVKRGLSVATCDVLPLTKRRSDRLAHACYNRYVRLFAHLHPHAPGFCIAVRRAVHEQIGGFDESVVFCEDHDYVVRASKVGRFGILRSVNIPVSVRRFDRDGRFLTGVKYVLAELHILLIGPIRSQIFHYTFGHK